MTENERNQEVDRILKAGQAELMENQELIDALADTPGTYMEVNVYNGNKCKGCLRIITQFSSFERMQRIMEILDDSH